MASTKIGLIVNPIAGMGGSVGLKGTDGSMYQKALERGADPVTPGRTEQFLSHLNDLQEVNYFAAPGEMGSRYLDRPHQVVGEINSQTSAEDTRRIARKMREEGVELLVFIGGDGTARDIADAVGTEIPVVAVPAGVKMYSAAFSVNPRSAAEMVTAFVEGSPLSDEEVLDIDEEAYREDRLASRLYGYLSVPRVQRLLQGGKIMSNSTPDAAVIKEQIADYLVEKIMQPDTLYLLGPGTTVRAVTDALDLPKTLLGVDAVRNRQLVGEDLNEGALLNLLDRHPQAGIIVTPIGGNGFILGRGSKQFTPEVIRRVGKDHLLVIATRSKLSRLDCLRVDSGDPQLDAALAGYTKVITNYLEGKVVKIRC